VREVVREKGKDTAREKERGRERERGEMDLMPVHTMV